VSAVDKSFGGLWPSPVGAERALVSVSFTSGAPVLWERRNEDKRGAARGSTRPCHTIASGGTRAPTGKRIHTLFSKSFYRRGIVVTIIALHSYPTAPNPNRRTCSLALCYVISGPCHSMARHRLTIPPTSDVPASWIGA
jgi:hypothetical protein